MKQEKTETGCRVGNKESGARECTPVAERRAWAKLKSARAIICADSLLDRAREINYDTAAALIGYLMVGGSSSFTLHEYPEIIRGDSP